MAGGGTYSAKKGARSAACHGSRTAKGGARHPAPVGELIQRVSGSVTQARPKTSRYSVYLSPSHLLAGAGSVTGSVVQFSTRVEPQSVDARIVPLCTLAVSTQSTRRARLLSPDAAVPHARGAAPEDRVVEDEVRYGLRYTRNAVYTVYLFCNLYTLARVCLHRCLYNEVTGQIQQYRIC